LGALPNDSLGEQGFGAGSVRLAVVASNKPNKDWESWARIDPYYAVLTADQYRKENISLDDFFGTGESHIAHIFQRIRQIEPAFQPKTALDFGCGVGRLLIPLSRTAQHVVGVDVSDTMLATARRNLEERSISNFTLVKSDDSLSSIHSAVDFVHSYIVFQHIPVTRGEKTLIALLSKLAPGGMGALHFPFWKYGSLWRKFANAALNRINVLNYFSNVMRGRPLREPRMQYNTYSLGRLLKILYEQGCSTVNVEILADSPVNVTALLYFKKHELGEVAIARR
jgi:2-polyprenyl-3-methyl-5-hydroxy-6-metoxy-1,4-benzoquinol methylase